jgi:UDP-3-O-[3-hydroxymyristoyl] glucosamine N-acyltransferase
MIGRIGQRVSLAWRRHGWRIGILALVKLHPWEPIRRTVAATRLRLVTHGKKGRGIICENSVTVIPGSVLVLGDRVQLGRRCFLETTIEPLGSLGIGADSWLSHDCHIATSTRVSIGRAVRIGEFTSIRDTTHKYDAPDIEIWRQGDIYGTIDIEDDVWIGRGCLIQGRPEGLRIGRGAVIGANSVVTKSIPPLQVWGGVPARFIKNR